MEKYLIKISPKGQIAIPKKIRDKLNADILEMEFSNGTIILKPAESIQEIAGSLKKYVANVPPHSDMTQEETI